MQLLRRAYLMARHFQSILFLAVFAAVGLSALEGSHLTHIGSDSSKAATHGLLGLAYANLTTIDELVDRINTARDVASAAE